jgi:hypothetical protein
MTALTAGQLASDPHALRDMFADRIADALTLLGQEGRVQQVTAEARAELRDLAMVHATVALAVATMAQATPTLPMPGVRR